MFQPVLLGIILFYFASDFLSISVSAPDYFPEAPYTNNYGRCISPQREQAFCIKLSDCYFLYNYWMSSQLSEADKVFFRRSQCGYHRGNVLICCPNRHRFAAPVAKRTTTVVNNLLPKPGKCGPVLSNRIYGGNVAKIDEFPWLALIEYTKPSGVKAFHCGGSLISARYVVTAAHCVKGSGISHDWKLSGVRLGEWNIQTDPDCELDQSGHNDCAPRHRDIAVTRAIAHHQYVPHSKNQLNDIALLRLEDDVVYTDFVRPICLPVHFNFRSTNFNGIVMEVAGWGKTETMSSSSIKLKTALEVVAMEKCRNVYRKQYAGIFLKDSQICAGGQEGVDTCRGDSGGSLIGMVTSDRKGSYYFLAGIVSFGPTPCGQSDWPGIYTRVTHFVDWIQQTIEE